MSEKYLIDQASLTALADITRAYNETPDKEYTLAEVTEQVKTSSENFYNLFENGISLLESETAKSIKGYGLCGVMQASNKGVINLPKVTTIEMYALQGNYISGFNIPSVTMVKSYAFRKCKWYTPLYFPELLNIESYAFTESEKASISTAYNIYAPKLETLGTGAFNNGKNVLILKTLPTLEGIPEWVNSRYMTVLLTPENYAKATSGTEANWSEVTTFLKEATTYDSDYSKYWSNFVTKGILTEEEIRRDYYGETFTEGGES